MMCGYSGFAAVAMTSYSSAADWLPGERCYPTFMRFTAAVTSEGKLYVAQCLEIELASQGETIEAALVNLREALELRLEREPDVTLPGEPPIIATVEVAPPAA